MNSSRGWLVAAVTLAVGCKNPPDALPGCFDIRNGPAFANLQEAVDAAESGDTIKVCAGPSSGEVVVEGKDLIFEGKDDGLTFFYSEGTAFVVRNAEVTVTNMTVSAVESAAKVFDGTLRWEGANVEEVGGTLIDAFQSDVWIDHADFNNAPLGGIHLEGGTLDLRDSNLNRIASYGVKMEGGVVATIEDNTFDDVYYTGNASYLFTADGIGVQTMNFDDIALARNEFSNIGIAAVQIEAGKLTMDGDIISDSYAGLLTLAGDITLSNLTIDLPRYYGVYARTSNVTLNDVNITVSPEESAGAAGSGSAGSVAIIAPGSNITMNGGSLVGANGGGLIAQALTAVTQPIVILDGVRIENNGRFGVAVDLGTLTATDVTITDTRDRDEICTDSATGERFCSAGVWLIETGATWTGGSITGDSAFGVWANTARFDAVDTEITGAETAIYGLDTAVLLDGIAFADHGDGIRIDGGSVDVRASTFTGGHGTSVYSEDREGVIHAWETTGGGIDVFAEPGIVVISEVTFTDGDQGVVMGAGANGQVLDSTFTNYTQRVLGVEGGKIEATDVTATETGGDAVVCVDGEVWLESVALEGVRTWVAETTYSVDGVAVETTDEVRVDPALRGLRCHLVAEDLAVRDVAGVPATWWNGVFEADGLIIDKALSGVDAADAVAIELAWTERAPGAVLDDVAITNLYRGDGVRMSVAEGLEPGFIELVDVSVADVPGDGVVLTGGTHRLSGVTVTGAGGWGMTCDATLPPAFAACDVSLDGASGAAQDCSGCP